MALSLAYLIKYTGALDHYSIVDESKIWLDDKYEFIGKVYDKGVAFSVIIVRKGRLTHAFLNLKTTIELTLF